MTTSLRAFDALAANKRQHRGTPVPHLAVSQIAPLPGQPRQSFDAVKLEELAGSIRAHGIIQPIVVVARKDIRDDDPVRYYIVCGERRYQAAKLAEMDSLPALVRDYSDDEVALLALLENLQREDLTPLEEGEYLIQLKSRFGFTEEQLGERLGKSRDYVHMRTRLLNLHPDILATWKSAESVGVFATLTPSHAILVNQVEDADLRAELVRSVMETGITVAETRRRLALLKVIDEAPLREEAAAKLRLSAVKGAADAFVSMVIAKEARRDDVSEPQNPPLAVQDLGVYRLIEKLVREEAAEVPLRELEAALKKDMAWVRKIKREGLA